MQIKASTVAQYLRKLPAERRQTIAAIREVILENIDTPLAEGIQDGMISYYVPHSVFPDGYHCNPEKPLPFAAIGAQKRHIGLYLFCVYCDPKQEAWFRSAWLKAGKKLDMGKSCVRIKTLEDVPLEVVATLFRRAKAKKFIAQYEASRPTGRGKGAKKR